MKREFLQNLTVDGQSLSKEVIDAIMAENGRDIEAVKARFAELDGAAGAWEEKYNQALTAHREELANVVFGHNLEKAIMAAKGRNAKAITALLDVDALKTSENQQTALEEALQTLKQECSYLFQVETPPPYARGTGAMAQETHKGPATLAGALLEKFERK